MSTPASAPSPPRTAGHLLPSISGPRRWLKRLVGFIYGLVMFEVVIMVSPFAFYFYSAYGPTLKWLNHSAVTAWLTGFILPHAVFTTSPLLEFMRWDFGRYAFGFGILAFLVLAAQIYGAKLFRRGKAVTSFGYRYIRHPQYLALSIAAFGLLTMWPRMIIFLLFIGMLVTYYLLARFEESRMLEIDPTYANYMRRTGMFLPGNPGGRLFRAIFGKMRDQRVARRLTLASCVVLAFALGLALRHYTVTHVSALPLSANMEVISVYPKDSQSLQRIASLALSNESVRSALAREGNAQFVIHALPQNYGMIGMFADVGEHHMRPGNIHLSRFAYLRGMLLPFLDRNLRTDIMGTDSTRYRVVFSRVDDPQGHPVPRSALFHLSAKMTPVYIADVDATTGTVMRTIDPPRRSFWGDVKMPIF